MATAGKKAMIQQAPRGDRLIIASFIIALMLTMLPMPNWAAPGRPEWVSLVLIYWCMALPHRIGVGIGWFMGLLLDVVQGAVLGQHALALTLVALVTVTFHLRLRLYPLRQQALFIMSMIAMQQALVLWVKGVIGEAPAGWQYWTPTFTSMVLWPWVFLLLRDARRQCGVT